MAREDLSLPVTQSSEISGSVSAVSVVVMPTWPDGGVVGRLRWRMDKMDVERDEDNVFFPSSSTSASNASSCAEPSARRSSLNGTEGYAELSEAALSDRGVEEVESG